MLELSEIWKIDGKSIFQPSGHIVSMEDLETSAERTADGILHRERARQGVRKVGFSYDLITQEELSQLIPMLAPEFIKLTYLDPEYGIHTIEAYCSRKQSELYSAVFYNGLWRAVQFNVIER